MEEIILSAYQQEDEDRFERLILLLQITRELCLETKIKRLHDHKGFLSVVWEVPPTTEDSKAVRSVWETVFNEIDLNVQDYTEETFKYYVLNHNK